MRSRNHVLKNAVSLIVATQLLYHNFIIKSIKIGPNKNAELRQIIATYSAFLFGSDDGISARGGLADKQSTGLFGASESYALAHKLLAQFSPYFKSHHPYKQKEHNRKGYARFVESNG